MKKVRRGGQSERARSRNHQPAFSSTKNLKSH